MSDYSDFFPDNKLAESDHSPRDQSISHKLDDEDTPSACEFVKSELAGDKLDGGLWVGEFLEIVGDKPVEADVLI